METADSEKTDDTDKSKRSASEPMTVRLRKPIPHGSQPIEELTLKPTSRAFKDFSLPMTAELKIDYQPYALALVGLKMAGYVVDSSKLIDRMDPKDMVELSQAVLGFFA